jgi:hypothetical protein
LLRVHNVEISRFSGAPWRDGGISDVSVSPRCFRRRASLFDSAPRNTLHCSYTWQLKAGAHIAVTA